MGIEELIIYLLIYVNIFRIEGKPVLYSASALRNSRQQHAATGITQNLCNYFRLLV